MKKLIYVFAAAALLSACTADLENQQIAVGKNPIDAKILNSSNGCVGGAIIVRFNSSAESRLAECATRSGATRTGVSGVDAVLDGVNGCAVEPIFIVTEKNREKVYAGGYHLWYELRFDESSDMEHVAAELAKVGEIAVVEYVKPIKRISNPKVITSDNIELLESTRATIQTLPFNDTYNQYQWNLNNLGDKSKVKISPAYNSEGLSEPVAGADVNVVPAWKLCKGDPSIVVAVLDEGVMNTHEDLANNIWVNKTELNGRADFDDDSNGYKDDVYGFNFSTLKGTITWNNQGDSGHGSHVAGIIAAVNDNGIGVSSIAGGSGKGDGVKLMSIQIFNGSYGVTATNMSRAMQYAADNGAHILQNSWGYLSAEAESSPNNPSGPGNDRNYKYLFSAEAAAIDYFVKNGGSEDGPIDGGLAIFAAGNSGASLPSYPAAYEPCVAVASFSPSLHPAYYTDYGIGTDVVAPGGESIYEYGSVLSTVPAKYATSGTKYYAMMQGTSQACPHVSGVAALGLSYAKQLGKRYTAKEFRSMLLASTHSMDPYLTGTLSFKYGKQYYVDYPSYKGKLGAGYIDAYKLLLQVEGTPCKVVKVGDEVVVDLSLYFGDGIGNAQFVSAVAPTEEIEATGLTIGDYTDGKISIKTTKAGAATISVTMLVGGGSLDDNKKPFPTEVVRKFVVISKSGVASNNGWL